MSRFLFDEDIHHAIVRGLRQRRPHLDAHFVEEVMSKGAEDLDLLNFATRESYVLVTHDANNLPRRAFQRIQRNEPMAGLIVVRQRLPLESVIGDLITLSDTVEENEWAGQIYYFPL